MLNSIRGGPGSPHCLRAGPCFAIVHRAARPDRAWSLHAALLHRVRAIAALLVAEEAPLGAARAAVDVDARIVLEHALPSSNGSNPCKQLDRLLRRRPSCLSFCRYGRFFATIVMLTFVLGGWFEGAAECSLRRLRQDDAGLVTDGSGASRRFRVAVSLACDNELAHVT